MLESMTIGVWDLVLVVVVSIQATILAYLHHPLWKGFMLLLPMPFTVAFLALGRPVDATNILGLVTLLIYTHGVRLLHDQMGVPIVPAIVLAAGGYCVIGGTVAQLVPSTDSALPCLSLAAWPWGGCSICCCRTNRSPGIAPVTDPRQAGHHCRRDRGAGHPEAAPERLHGGVPHGRGGGVL